MNKKAQIVLETGLVIVAVVILLVGIMRLWAWFVDTFSGRWESYNKNRVQAGTASTYSPGGFVPDNYEKEDLNLFK